VSRAPYFRNQVSNFNLQPSLEQGRCLVDLELEQELKIWQLGRISWRYKGVLVAKNHLWEVIKSIRIVHLKLIYWVKLLSLK
jgi:hypothetical protein